MRKKGIAKITALCLALSLTIGSILPAAAAETESETESQEQKVAASFPADFDEGERWENMTVTSMEDAAKVVSEVAAEMSTDERLQFEPWRMITDSEGNNYYVFRQMYGDVTVSGGAVKVVTDPDGEVLGVVTSVETKFPDTDITDGITASEAEKIVSEELKNGHPSSEILEGRTVQTILPVELELDPDVETEKEEVRFVWVVYTTNDTAAITGSSELPYLAHYVTMQGEYLYSLPTLMPEDEASDAGFDAAYVFEFMEPADYTGTVKLPDGTEQEITVSLMRDKRTGMYYMGNVERRIAVANCYDFLYNKGSVILEASPDNTGWDNTCLLSLYNYCRVWDYYDALGWKSGDGLGTPMIILKDYCDKKGNPVDNAAYAGQYYGWQVFLSSGINQFSGCLDVLAHEFTHSVTHSVMTHNAYSNDYGAINEAISDIHGNICEMMNGATEDTTWELGENSDNPVRSMSDPHKYKQPEYVWDIYYTPPVLVPTEINDRGGVHSNSSLLNRIAYFLCEEGGMTLEDARVFWFAVDCSMVPGTDYPQTAELLPWVLENVHLEKYMHALEYAIDKTKIAESGIPETLASDQAMITMELPDTDLFKDGNWMLGILSVDAERIKEAVPQMLKNEGEYKGAVSRLRNLLVEAVLQDLLDGEDEQAYVEAIKQWIDEYLNGALFLGSGTAGADGRTIRMVGRQGYTIPVLLYLKFEPNSIIPSAADFAVYLKGKWAEIGKLAKNGPDLSLILNPRGKLEEFWNWLNEGEAGMFFEITKDGENKIPSDGLEDAKPLEGPVIEGLFEMATNMALEQMTAESEETEETKT